MSYLLDTHDATINTGCTKWSHTEPELGFEPGSAGSARYKATVCHLSYHPLTTIDKLFLQLFNLLQLWKEKFDISSKCKKKLKMFNTSFLPHGPLIHLVKGMRRAVENWNFIGPALKVVITKCSIRWTTLIVT